MPTFQEIFATCPHGDDDLTAAPVHQTFEENRLLINLCAGGGFLEKQMGLWGGNTLHTQKKTNSKQILNKMVGKGDDPFPCSPVSLREP